MKQIIIQLISLYQSICSSMIKQALGAQRMCRYSPSCSEYTKHMVEKHGVIKGLWYGAKRLTTCHPFSNQRHAV